MKRRMRGQGLVEFALVMPILLFLLMGIFDFSRVLITYAVATNSLRTGLRYAAVLGYNEDQAQFANCAAMRNVINQAMFAGTPTITIQYQKASNGSFIPCPVGTNNINSNLLANGDMLQISVNNTVRLITPLVSNIVPNLPINIRGQRTIVNFISLTDLYETDKDFDGLADAWEVANFGSASAVTGTDDPDLDRCNNGCEESRGTNPNDSDSDDDFTGTNPRLLDGDEIYVYNSNPLAKDTDGDLLWDADEVACGTAPASIDGVPPNPQDTDGDGVLDNVECGWGPFVPGPDYDLDGLSDAEEIVRGTRPDVADTDLDGLKDGEEVFGQYPLGTPHSFGSSDPLTANSDVDGLNDYAEVVTWGTKPQDPDTDNDGLNDGDEVNLSRNVTITLLNGSPQAVAVGATDPRLVDSDGDGLNDGYELANKGTIDTTSPRSTDTDSDGLRDNEEIYVYGTSPAVQDTDGDGLMDGAEVNPTGFLPVACGTNVPRPVTNPGIADIDGDGQNDSVDCTPNGEDTDADGLRDAWEEANFGTGNFTQTGTDDPDSDGCNNTCEQTNLTNPNSADTDGDGLNDGPEINGTDTGNSTTGFGATNPKVADTDGDGLSDGREITPTGTLTIVTSSGPSSPIFPRTNPNNQDTDGDSLTDGEEVDGRRGPTEHGLGSSDPTRSDTDGDGVTDYREVLGNPLLTITGIRPGTPPINFSYTVPPTRPSHFDHDGDGLSDFAEIFGLPRTDPTLPDTDGDGLYDKRELDGDPGLSIVRSTVSTSCTVTPSSIPMPATNPVNWDSDGDTLSDAAEANRQVSGIPAPTNPKAVDTDGDGINDQQELAGDTTKTIEGTRLGGTDFSYTVPDTNPLHQDTDGDCAADNTEINRQVSGSPAPTDPTVQDTDNDGLTDRAELLGSPTLFVRVNGILPGYSVPATDPLHWDTDGDTLSDSAEVNRQASGVPAPTDPTKEDTDGDTDDDTEDDPLNAPPADLSIVATRSLQEPTTNTPETYMVFPVTLTNPRAGVTVTVRASTSSGSASVGSCANNGEDYEAANQILTFAPGTTTQNFQVRICADNRNSEGNETFNVVLSDPVNAIITSGQGTSTGTITP